MKNETSKNQETGNNANLLLEAVPIEVQKYLADIYKKVSFGRKPTNISQYGGSIFVMFSKNECYRINISLYNQNIVTLD
jgi:hypothetical protein